MIIKVTKSELEETGVRQNNYSERLKEEFINWEKEIEELKTLWDGYDAKIFYDKNKDMLAKLKQINEVRKIIGDFIIKSKRVYEEEDELLSQTLKQENSRYGKKNNNK